MGIIIMSRIDIGHSGFKRTHIVAVRKHSFGSCTVLKKMFECNLLFETGLAIIIQY